MTPEEVLLSESQERMLLVVQQGREDDVLGIARTWGLSAAVIGRVVEPSVLTVRDGDRIVAHLNPQYLTEAPEYAPEAVEPAYLHELRRAGSVGAAGDRARPTRSCSLLGSPAIARKRWVFRQYDHMVQTNTVVPPGADAAVLRVPDAAPRGLALAVDGNGRALLPRSVRGRDVRGARGRAEPGVRRGDAGRR